MHQSLSFLLFTSLGLSLAFGSIRFDSIFCSACSLASPFSSSPPYFQSGLLTRLDSSSDALCCGEPRVGLARNASSVSDSGARILGRKFSGCLVGLFVASPYRILELLIHFTNDGKSLFKFVGHHLRVDIVQSDERSYLPDRAKRAPGYEKRMAINEN